MEHRLLNNLDDIEIADESHKNQFISILSFIGIYNDIASIIYSYKYYYTGIKQICKVDDFYSVDDVKLFFNNVLIIRDGSYYCYVMENKPKSECNDERLIKLSRAGKLSLKGQYDGMFEYDNSIYLLYIDVGYTLYRVLIDYDAKTYKIELAKKVTSELKLLESDGTIKHEYKPKNQSISIIDDKIIVDCHMTCNYRREVAYSMTYLYEMTIDELMKGCTQFKAVDIVKLEKSVETSNYITNNFHLVCYEDTELKKTIYIFKDDNTFYNYEHECLTHLEGQDCNNTSGNFERHNKDILINILDKKVFISLPNQDNYIELDYYIEKGVKLVKCGVIAKNTLYLHYTTDLDDEENEEIPDMSYIVLVRLVRLV